MPIAKSPYIDEIRGSLVNVDIRTRKNKKIEIAKFRFPSNPNTPAQQEQRNKYGKAVGAWRSLTPEQKAQWNEQAKPLGISGWNLYVKTYINVPPIVLPTIMQLREHKVVTDYSPDFTFTKYDATTLQVYGPTPSLGYGYVFAVFPATWLQGKVVKIRWMGTSNYDDPDVSYLQVYDGEYDRKNDNDFPTGSYIPTKGNGLLQTLSVHRAIFNWTTDTSTVNINPALEKVTLMITIRDAWIASYQDVRIDYIEIWDSTGQNLLWKHDFTNNVVMERTGTYGDYGYIQKE